VRERQQYAEATSAAGLALELDLDFNSAVRRRFTEEVLRRPLAAVRAYWQQRIFSAVTSHRPRSTRTRTSSST
jgi:hypothetical protein